MDFFTHALLPYLLGTNLGLGNKRLAALVLGGMAPDLDVLFSWLGSICPASLLFVHRGITHSLLFGFFFGLLVLYLAALPRIRGLLGSFIKYDLDLSLESIALVYSGVLMHLLLDFTTTRGIPQIYPMEELRYSADVFYQIEPILLLFTLFILTALLRDRSLIRFRKSLFVLFLVFLLLVGGIRLEGKQAALDNFTGENAVAYPEPGLFSWALIEDRGDRYLASEYDFIDGNITGWTMFPRLHVASNLDEAKKEIGIADKLNQVQLFRWRAYAVAINATESENGSWQIEYYDPIVRLQTQEKSRNILRLPSSNFGAVRATVKDGVAVVMD